MQIVPMTPEIAGAQVRWDALSKVERGTWIQAAMDATGSRTQALADRLFVTFPAVHAWLLGESECDWSRWMSVTLALGLPETWRPTDAQEKAARAKVAEKIAKKAGTSKPAPAKKKAKGA
jgi:hypothetical protein